MSPAVLLAVPSAGTSAAGDGGITIHVRRGAGPVIEYQVSPEPWCPGQLLPTFVSYAGAAGDEWKGSATISGALWLGPCTSTTGSGSCTVVNPSTLTWDMFADASGIILAQLQTVIPANAPSHGQICLSIAYTVTPVGGAEGEPVTELVCVDHSCPPVPLAGREALTLMALLIAVAALLALSRRSP